MTHCLHPLRAQQCWLVADEPEGVTIIADMMTEPNARRLAACWNAMLELSTERIEEIADEILLRRTFERTEI